MNLVQINERLKDLPLQAVQQYANGMNPEIPPYLALAEIQRRQKMQQQMANAQGAAQGQQPSVKEQIEQKAGLMGLQQAQMQQQQAQMMQPRPGPVPAGIPQPEPQPQAQEMAGGGIARIPVRNDLYRFADGGIIAFQAGGDVAEKYRRESEEMGEGKRMQFSPDVQEYARKIRAEREAQQAEFATRERQQMLAQSRELAPAMPPVVRDPNITRQTMNRVGPMTAPRFADPRIVGVAPKIGAPEAPAQPSGLAALAGARPAAPPATPMAAAAPRPAPAAAPQVTTSPFIAEAAAAAREKPVEPTAESIKAGVAALSPQAMTEEAMQKRAAEQRARAEAERKAYETSRPSGLDELIRVFGQAGQYKGLSGTGPAYTAMQQQKRAEDLAMEKRFNEMLTAIEGREVGEAKDLFGARTSAMEKAQQSYQNRLAANTKALADLAGTDQRRIDETLDRLSSMEVAKLQAATQNRSLNEKLKFEADFLSLKAKARELAEKGDTQGAARLEARANDMLTIRGGAAAGVGAARNVIAERRLEMQNLEKIMKDEGMQYTDEQRKEAAQEYRRLALLNTKESGAGAPAGAKSAGVDTKNPLLQ